MIKRLVVIFTVLTVFCTSCCPAFKRYKNKKYYTKENTIANDSIFKLCQMVSFSPRAIDAGHVSRLYLTFLDTNAAKTKKVLHLETDTLIVKSKYDFWSVWFWDDYNPDKIKGTIKILQWDTDKIILKENISVIKAKKRVEKYREKSTFYYKKQNSQ